MKKAAIALFLGLVATAAQAQERSSAFNVLRLPVSAHAAALGGNNVSLIEDDPTLTFANPALLASVSDLTLHLSFMTYMKDAKVGSASFVKTASERHTFAAQAQFIDYGSMDETDADGVKLGSFTAKDIVLGGQYSYLLTDRWSGGAALKFVYSKYAEYSALALAVDVGLNYFDEEHDFSFGVAMRNVGAQLKKFDEKSEHLPFVLEAGITQGVANAPLRFSITLTDLTRWKSSDYYTSDGSKVKFGRKVLNHLAAGIEVLPTHYLWLGAGYNARRAYELKAGGSAHGAGLSFGGGLQLKRLKLGVSYAKYHQTASSVLGNISYKF